MYLSIIDSWRFVLSCLIVIYCCKIRIKLLVIELIKLYGILYIMYEWCIIM